MTDLVSLQEYKEYKNLTNNTDDVRRTSLISAVSKLVETYCDRAFKRYVDTPVVEFHSALNTEVHLDHFPVLNIDSVELSEDGGMTYEPIVFQSPEKDGYLVNLEEGILYTQYPGIPFKWSVERAFNSMRVTYTAGYEELPLDLKLAVFDLVYYYEKEENIPSKSLMSGNIENPIPYNSIQFPSHISRILNMYRAPMMYRD